MGLLIAVFVVAAAAVLLVLSIPIDLGIDAEAAATRKIQVRLGWLFGLVAIHLPGTKPYPQRAPRQRKPGSRRKFTFRKLKSALLTKGLCVAIARFLRRSWGAIRIREFRLHVLFGLDDPADTGMLVAAAAPVLWIVRKWFSAEPDFDREILRAEGKVDVRIYPIRIITASVMFVLSPSTLRAAFQLL